MAQLTCGREAELQGDVAREVGIHSWPLICAYEKACSLQHSHHSVSGALVTARQPTSRIMIYV